MMEVLMIGKPAMNVYLPLQEFPQEGDIFNIKNKNESLGNVAATSACLLSKWGLSANFTGVVGNDGYGEKIRDIFKEFKVKTKYLETDFLKATSSNYLILNVKTGMVTKVLQNDPEMALTKYKYDFKPDWAIIDGTDQAGAHALLNNDGSVKTVFYARVGDRDTVAMSKRCTHVVCTQTFAEQLTKTTTDYTADSLVAFYQRIVDAVGSSNYIVVLNNHKVLYSEDGKVKMLPEMKINEVDKSSFDSLFVGAFTFGMISNLDINDSIKLANTASALSLCKIGEVTAIPELDEVLQNSGLKEKLEAAIRGEVVQTNTTAPAPLNPEYKNEEATFTPTPEVVNTTASEYTPVDMTPDAFKQAPYQEGNTQYVPNDVAQATYTQGMVVDNNVNAFNAQTVEAPVAQAAPVAPVTEAPVPAQVAVAPQVEMPQPVNTTNTTNV